MINSDVYQKCYGIRPLEVLPGFAPLYEMKSLLGRTLLSTSPFLTDTPELPNSVELQDSYHRQCVSLMRTTRAHYALIKTRDPLWAERMHQDGSQISHGFVTSVLDMKRTESEIWSKALHRKRRSQVERGYDLDPEFHWGRHELLEDFYRVFSATQTRLGTPVHGLNFFQLILDTDPNAQLLVARVEGRPASAALLLIHNDTLFHPYTGTLPAYFPSYLNSTLYWEMIRFGVREQIAHFDMGRSFAGSGVHQFKKYWGTRDVPLFYCYDFDGPRGKIPELHSPWYRMATRLWSHLPVSLATRLGPHLIRSVP